jgi:crotonobetainyl-CoA:carnitine CoA-transferase CaiB-like acyl-CoA transferase
MLSPLTVLEAGGGPAADLAAGLLTDLGARTLLVEPTGWRLRDTPGFHVWSRGKQSLVAEDMPGRVAELAPRFDVLVIDEEDWHAAGQPTARRVTAVIQSLGEDWSTMPVSRASASSIAEALGGMDYTKQGYRDGPFFVVEPVADFATGALSCIGTLAALYANADDQTEVVRVSHLAGGVAIQLFSAVAARNAPHVELMTDGDPLRITTPSIRFYKTGDGKWMMIGAASPALWAKLCLVLEMPELLGDPRYLGAPFNIPDAAARNELADRIAATMATRTRAEWLERFREGQAIAGAVLHPDQALDTPEVQAAGLRMEVDHPSLGRLVMPGVPIQVKGAEPELEGPAAPERDQHDAGWLAGLEAGEAPVARPADRTTPPLDGLHVMEIASLAAAPGAVRLLGGMGAEVTKLEPPEGDPFRTLAYTFGGLNRGKRSVVLNLRDQAGRSELEDVLKSADVLIHNLRPAGAKRTRLATEDLRALNPDLVECRVAGYGLTPSAEDRPSIDFVFESLCGAPLVQGGGESPVGWSGGIADNGTSLLGAVAALAGLYARKHGGGAISVGVSLLATLLHRHADLLVSPLSDWRNALLGPDPVGPTAAHRLYRTRDDWLLLAVTSPGEWERLAELDPRLGTVFQPEDEAWSARVSAVLEELLVSEDAERWLERLHPRGIPAVVPRPFSRFALEAADQGSRLTEDFHDPKWGGLVGIGELITFEAPGWQELGPPPVLSTMGATRS